MKAVTLCPSPPYAYLWRCWIVERSDAQSDRSTSHLVNKHLMHRLSRIRTHLTISTAALGLGAVSFMLLSQGCTTFPEDWSSGLGRITATAHQDESDIRVEEGVIHVVQDGETLMSIARAYEVTVQKLSRINRIEEPDHIIVGQRLFVPGAKTVLNPLAVAPAATPQVSPPTATPTPVPVIHVVHPGESLQLISKTYDVAPRVLQRVNNISDVRSLPEGQELLIPGAEKVLAVAVPTPTPTPKPVSVEPPKPKAIDPYTGAANTHVDLPSAKLGAIEFSWPIVEGFRLANKFNARSSSPCFGIDLQASDGMPVYSAADGEVFLVGTPADDFGPSYGNHIILYHGTHEGKGIRTIYTQLSSTEVKAGQKVKRGDLIGRVGQSGRPAPGVDGPFLHFELRSVEVALDPLKYLPKQ